MWNNLYLQINYKDCLSHQMFMLHPSVSFPQIRAYIHVESLGCDFGYFIDQMCDGGGGGGGGDHRRPSRDRSPDCAASPPPGRSLASYLMQLSGSRSQSVLHMNLSQCSQPIVGCRARPLSSASAAGGGRRPRSERRNTPPSISIHLLSQRTMVNNATVSPLDLFPDAARFNPAHLLLLPWMTDVKTDQ